MERWIASAALIRLLRSGLTDCPFDTRVKIIYGFEQVLPQVAYAWYDERDQTTPQEFVKKTGTAYKQSPLINLWNPPRGV